MALVRLFHRDEDGIRWLVASVRVEAEEMLPMPPVVHVAEDSDVRPVLEAAEPVPLIQR